MKSTISTTFAASALALLSACGGSGDGGTAQPVGPAGLSITSGNQAAVSRATVTGGLAVSSVETATSAGGATVQPTSIGARGHALAALARRVLGAGLTPRATIQSASTHPLAIVSDTQACAAGGSLTATFNDVDGNQQISAGDILSIQFNDCRDSATSLYNGKAVITISTVPSAEQITANADFQNVSAVEGGLTSTVDGTLSIAETESVTESDITLTVGAGGLTETMASAGYNDVVTLEAGLRITVDDVFATNRSTMTFDGVLDAQSVGGGVTLTTKSPIVLLDSDTYPSAGAIQAKGAHGTLLVTVLGTTSVQMQLDADDDGTYESTTTTSWTSLIPQ